jgi:hypothetical protein
VTRKKAGWFGESVRHSLASKGVKTATWLPKRYKRSTPTPIHKARPKPAPRTPYDEPGFDPGSITIHDNARDIDKATLDALLYRFERGDWGSIDKGDKEMQEMMLLTYDIYDLPGTINGMYMLDEKRGIVLHHVLRSGFTEVWSIQKRASKG